MSAVAWSVVYSYGILDAIKLALFMILRDYLSTGIVVATILWCGNISSHILGLLSDTQVHRKSALISTSIPFHARRLIRGMGLRL